jgi:hypothetical protein
MKSREEFKRAIYRKRDQVQAARQARRRKTLFFAAPLVLTAMICGIMLTPSLFTPLAEQVREGPGNESAPLPAISVTVALAQQQESSGSPTETHLTDRERIAPIAALLMKLERQEPVAPPADPEEEEYTLTIGYADQTEQRYVKHGERFLQKDNGAWLKMDSRQAAELKELMRGLTSAE